MASATLKTPPKPPADFNQETSAMWRDTINRVIETAGCIYKSDIPYVEMYCRSFMRWKQIQEHADISGLYDERMKLNDVFRLEADLAAKLRQSYRALEGTVLDRAKADAAGTGAQGGRTGVRQKASREGVPQVGSAKKTSSGGVSWLDDARKKADKKVS